MNTNESKLQCQECGYEDTWDSISENTIPADADEQKASGDGKAYVAKIICPDCGNDKFDHLHP